MDPDRGPWARAHAIVDAALDQPADRLDAFLSDACAGDAALESRVRQWLFGIQAAAADPPSVLGGYRHAPAEPVGSAPDRIGHYRIVRILGTGGMGTVFEGERDDGTFRHRVAIKMMRPAIAGSGEFVQRFNDERQILASLSHPNIAGLLDGDVTADGVPYCVLEYVEGHTLTGWCDARGLDLRGRIALVRQVCGAVGHAHTRLVVHRDIKPSNVLVTDDGVVKLLDFGIARLIDDSGEHAAITRPDGWPAAMTPEYASPEQFRGAPLGVATDVYSLGVVLHELLTGARPFPAARGWLALHDVVTHQEAPLVSSAPITPDDARHRGASVTALRALLRGDLDCVVARALARDPARRYRSVDELDADLMRYLAGEPVQARNGGRGYHIRKFVWRNRVAVGAAVIAAVTILTASLTAVLQARRLAAVSSQAMLERNAALDLSRVMLGFLELSWPWDSGGTTRALRPLLDSAGSRLLDPAGQLGSRYPYLLQSLASGYLGLGDYPRALAVEQRVLQLLEARGAPRDTLGLARMRVAESLRQSGRTDEGLALSAQAIADLMPTHPVLVTRLRIARARGLRRVDRAPEASASLDTAMRSLMRDSTGTQLTQASVWEVRAELALDAGELDRAATCFRRSLDLRLTARAPALEIGNGYGDLGKIALRQGDIRGADSLVTTAIERKSAAVGRAHPEVADEVASLAQVRLRQRRGAEALLLLEEALTVYRGVGRQSRIDGIVPLRDSLRSALRAGRS
ncbi:MAG: protein kinase [Gemmatimonadaceae bacterium]|nr:protein kinase [Gemmatimonadaceae bacterium]